MADAIASASAAAAPYVDQATTMYATYLQPYLPTSFCSAAATLDVYIATLIAEFLSECGLSDATVALS